MKILARYSSKLHQSEGYKSWWYKFPFTWIRTNQNDEIEFTLNDFYSNRNGKFVLSLNQTWVERIHKATVDKDENVHVHIRQHEWNNRTTVYFGHISEGEYDIMVE